MPLDTTRLTTLVRELYRIVGELEALAPGRHFTPDGHLVGSIGEVLAAHHYDLELLDASAETHDAKQGDRLIQVKATQGDRIAISSCPDFLLVVKLKPNGGFVEVYNGPGAPVWNLVNDKPVQKNGQRQVSLSSLRRLVAAPGHKAVLRRVR